MTNFILDFGDLVFGCFENFDALGVLVA